MEVWKDIINYNGKYQISNLGNVKRIAKISNKGSRKLTEKILTQSTMTTGYKFVSLKGDNKVTFNASIHRLLMIHFKPIENLEKYQVNHIDGIRDNNNLSNLEWCTQKENMQHSYKVLGRKGVNTGRFSKDNKGSIKINQYDKSGNFIKTWDSISEAARFIDKRNSDIVACLKGKQTTAFGYKWEYYKNIT